MTERSIDAERPGARRTGPATRRRLLARSAEPAATDRNADVQALLAHALETLVRETGCESAAVWSDEGGRAVTLAAIGRTPPPHDADYARLAQLPDATDLGTLDPDEGLLRFTRESGLAAAAPIPGGPHASAVLLLGGGADAPSAVRPRTLAALGATAARLAGPFGAAASLARLARLDAAVRRLDRLASLGELVAEIVHEIRNPLVSVKTFLQLLPERAAEPEFRDHFREVAAGEMRRIERLLDLVLAHARPVAPPRDSDRAELAATCESVVQLVSHRAADLGVAVQVVPGDAGLRVAISDDALRQIVLNLLLNALDATPRGGHVRVVYTADTAVAELRIEDEGPGIPEALRERIFEAFYSSKPDAPGGLGLAITRRIVEDAGGTITAEDREPRGSRFRVRLPI
ncbi:MAG TPA: HAMP domain-containing sensor histidine kinase [Myxococcota bacterium]|nr:HAMP domain-containing sensor histidine kinase [Myxococcota bacterium]